MQPRDDAQRLRELEARCAQLERELEEAHRTRDDFLATVSHELRGPIGAMALHVEALRQSLVRNVPNFPPPLLTKVDKLRAQMKRFVRRSTTLLDVSTLASGRVNLRLERLDLSASLNAVIEDITPEATFAGSSIDAQVQPDVEGEWDATACEQIATNLISNAIKYGSGKPIHVTLEADDAQAKLAVRDEGIGISADDVARIFERFERAVTDRRIAGFGIGLWVVRRLVEHMGGQINVSSQPGHGSVFYVTLPRGRCNGQRNEQ